MTTILAIDPGPKVCGWVAMKDGRLVDPEREGWAMATWAGVLPTDEMLDRVRMWHGEARLGGIPFLDHIVIETIEPWGGFTGPPALETMRTVGRLEGSAHPTPVTLLKRSDVLRALGVRVPAGQAKAAVRAALIERWGGGDPRRKDHPLYTVTSHAWSALAVAVTFTDTGGEP